MLIWTSIRIDIYFIVCLNHKTFLIKPSLLVFYNDIVFKFKNFFLKWNAETIKNLDIINIFLKSAKFHLYITSVSVVISRVTIKMSCIVQAHSMHMLFLLTWITLYFKTFATVTATIFQSFYITIVNLNFIPNFNITFRSLN